MIDEYLQYIQEGYIFDDKNISMDLHKFEDGELNILLLGGIGGAGKSTLGKKLAKKYKCGYIDSDFPCLTDKRIKDPERCFQTIYKKTIQSNKRYILEGVLVYFSCLNGPNQLNSFFHEMKGTPIILLGTSVMKAFYRNWKREASGETLWATLKSFLKYGWYYKDEMAPYKFFKKERASVKGTIIKPFKLM